MLKQKFGATNKDHYGMLWYFLEWSIYRLRFSASLFQSKVQTLMKNWTEFCVRRVI